MSGLGESYKCECCGGEFEKAWTDEEARAEAKHLWPEDVMARGEAIVCEDCFQDFMAWAKEKGLAG